MTSTLHNVTCASLPEQALPLLARVRHVTGVRVRLIGGRAWVWWEDAGDAVLHALLAAPGIELYERLDGFWHRLGQVLPAFHVPEEAETRPLTQVLTPAPVQPDAPEGGSPRRVEVRLVRDDRPRPATAVRAGIGQVAAWADLVPTPVLEQLLAARCGEEVLLSGPRLPLLPGGVRFWGKQLLAPLGWRVEPALPERMLCEVYGAGQGELVLWSDDTPEIVPLDAFAPLTRAGVRLAIRPE